MSLINRPFRGFSGVYTMPLPPLPSPSSTSTSLDSQRSTSTTSLTSADAAPKPRRSLFHRSKTSPQKHLRVPAPSSSSSSHSSSSASPPNRPAPPCRAHTAQLPPQAAAPPKSRFASLLRRHREEQPPRSEDVERELEELYVAVYSKAERRAFFREWKARQEERDAWEVEEWERGVVYEDGEEVMVGR